MKLTMLSENIFDSDEPLPDQDEFDGEVPPIIVTITPHEQRILKATYGNRLSTAQTEIQGLIDNREARVQSDDLMNAVDYINKIVLDAWRTYRREDHSVPNSPYLAAARVLMKVTEEIAPGESWDDASLDRWIDYKSPEEIMQAAQDSEFENNEPEPELPDTDIRDFLDDQVHGFGDEDPEENDNDDTIEMW
jgi:hypothetical protein